MRYAVISRTLAISQLEAEVKRCGGRNLKVAVASKQVFCDLEPAAIDKLKATGCVVSKVGGVRATVMPPIVMPPTPVAAAPVYTPGELAWAIGLEEIRTIFEPPLYGEGMNLAIIDSGIRKTHEKINGRVIYEKNYTDDPMGDGFDHGTGVCSIVLAIVPLCNILSLKVLNDRGEGTEEDVALAIDDCINLHDTNPNIAPTVINLSLGGPDDANPDNPLRVACRAAIEKGIYVHASAGNSGPVSYTITCPACEKYVFAIGSAKYFSEEGSFVVSEFSSRGPTFEGLIKPDVVMFGEDISVASSVSDTATTAKTGTSFATPFCSGMHLLYHESVAKWVTYEVERLPGVLPRGAIGPDVVSPAVMVEDFLPRICTKPSPVAAGKDNDYGNGIPLGSLVYQALTAIPAVDISTILTPVLAIMMMGMIIVPITKAMK
ncbi:hypothetical protein ES703_66729 [subsurface metagenome]